MKLKYGSIVCGLALGLASMAVAQNYSGTNRPANQSSTGDYMSSGEAYINSGPYGCVGCVADADHAAAQAAVNAAKEASGNPRALAGGAAGGGRAARAAAQVAQNGAAPAQAAPRRVGPAQNQPNPKPYDLLFKNGHVIDAKNNIDKVTDVGIKDGKIAAVADNLNPADAAKTIDVKDMYVIPGMVDLHMHMYATTGEAGSYAGDESIWPDGFTLRTGVTTAVDAGSSGWRNFEDFKDHVIDRSHTRVLAMLNIVGAGMRGARFEDNLADMNGELTGYMAKRYPGVIVGVKSAHYTGPEWQPYIEAVKAGTIAGIPVMVDYGSNRIERPMAELVTKYLRPGDIYTHVFSGLRGEQDTQTLKASEGLVNGRKHGVIFDVGAGGGSLSFRIAVPLVQGGFHPDSISTDLHITSMNSSTKDILNVMDKFLAMGLSMQEVVADTTWHPAHEIHQEQLGNLSVGAGADVAVLSVAHGNFGLVDMDNMRMMTDKKLVCEMTLRDGKIVYDLDGLSMDVWNQPPYSTDATTASHWTTFRPKQPLATQITPSAK